MFTVIIDESITAAVSSEAEISVTTVGAIPASGTVETTVETSAMSDGVEVVSSSSRSVGSGMLGKDG